MMLLVNMFNKYLITSMSSTFLYQLYNTHYIKIRRTDDKITRLLLGEKFIIISYTTLTAPIFFPFKCFYMLNKIDNDFNEIIDNPNEPMPTLLSIINT